MLAYPGPEYLPSPPCPHHPQNRPSSIDPDFHFSDDLPQDHPNHHPLTQRPQTIEPPQQNLPFQFHKKKKWRAHKTRRFTPPPSRVPKKLTSHSSKIYGFVSPESIPKARPLYRFAATGLSASMWFWVRFYSVGSTHGIIEERMVV
ncbi:hypothetical protein HYFRA_00014018 [Hymenoscyphus fraxineus]|uniref:Uncharacterized protein n=1 Tax=Hymenoscyphus fraxineus TaxID=746836 RepID=A0A9N9LE84_9HELO|nr:hypothetical protein HYFRA_00014018 [Hymenoscyphus fraxineus]